MDGNIADLVNKLHNGHAFDGGDNGPPEPDVKPKPDDDVVPKPEDDLITHPTWNDIIQYYFSAPYWVPGKQEDRKAVGKNWIDSMPSWTGIVLTQADSMNQGSVYTAIASGYMPPPPGWSEGGTEPRFYFPFPPEACEQFRLWLNDSEKDKAAPRMKKGDPIRTRDPIIPILGSDKPYKVATRPVWQVSTDKTAPPSDGDYINTIFTNPPWASPEAAGCWRDVMKSISSDIDLHDYDSVKKYCRTIYDHVASQSMPPTPPFFPPEAVEALRRWYNGGFPQEYGDLSKFALAEDPIPKGIVPQKPLRLRKNILDLTPAELEEYRTKLDTVMGAMDLGSLWQKGGAIHAHWCLHYQQASFPWHRAHLLWLENLIDFPIPYWNFYSKDAANYGLDASGIPPPFLVPEYKNSKGNIVKNPLCVAKARDGNSNASVKDGQQYDTVQRTPELVQKENGRTYIEAYAPLYLDQIHHALTMENIGDAEGAGEPFLYAPETLSDENSPDFYQYHKHEMDGMLEQVHDSIHGWTGKDMANNSYAAYDPIFWSFHANFDRLFEKWIRKNDKAVQWSSNYPLRPFLIQDGNVVADEDNPHVYAFTTIGDMVKDSKTMGYSYNDPPGQDYSPPEQPLVNGQKITDIPNPIVVFPAIMCGPKTYTIHVAIDDKQDGMDLTLEEVGKPYYIGFITRLGMGPDNGNNRCVKKGVVKRLEGTRAAYNLGLLGKDPPPVFKLKQLVIEGTAFDKNPPIIDHKDWDKGWIPTLVWDLPVDGIAVH